ncbi:MAG TPA: ABC transporter substrate-binding protein, partial [Ruminococcaceae bacterium]|nr:ABC transporter substrate-binding protein [Oscillospiraceae bacterium]
MKNFRKIIAFILSAIMTLSFASCSDSSLKVGIIQIAPHASLDNCYEGIVEGLKQAGYENGKNITIDYQNANGETATSNLMAKKMVSSKYDIIIGIATPAAMSAYSATRNTDIPVVFSAVSDPVTIQIVKSLEKPEYNCTGTTDVLNLEAQMEMIRTFLPNAKKIGVLYTTSEQNSVTHLNKFKSIAPDYGFEIVAVGVTNATEVATAAKTLVSKGIDCINNFTDNNVVNNLSSVLNAANTANIPVFGSEVEQVKNGCIAAEGLDYVHLGRETGMMAAKILEGDAKAGEMAA